MAKRKANIESKSQGGSRGKGTVWQKLLHFITLPAVQIFILLALIIDASFKLLLSPLPSSGSIRTSSIHGHNIAIGSVYLVTSAIMVELGYCCFNKETAGHISIKSPSLSLRTIRILHGSFIVFFSRQIHWSATGHHQKSTHYVK